jgi:hypothetical protein
MRKVAPRKPPKKRDEATLGKVRQMRCLLAGRRATITEWRGSYPKQQETFQVQHICASPKKSDAHHVQRKSQLGGDLGNVVPLCRFAHMELHQLGPKEFQKRWGIALPVIASQLIPKRAPQ